MWIKSHLEEGQGFSVRQETIYSEYVQYCNLNSLSPLSIVQLDTALKKVFPKILSQFVGNPNKFFYFGIKKQEIGKTPEILQTQSFQIE